MKNTTNLTKMRQQRIAQESRKVENEKAFARYIQSILLFGNVFTANGKIINPMKVAKNEFIF